MATIAQLYVTVVVCVCVIQ